MQNVPTKPLLVPHNQTVITILIIVSYLIIGFTCFVAGWHLGITSYMQECTHYPFLLLDPGQYWACPIP